MVLRSLFFYLDDFIWINFSKDGFNLPVLTGLAFTNPAGLLSVVRSFLLDYLRAVVGSFFSRIIQIGLYFMDPIAFPLPILRDSLWLSGLLFILDSFFYRVCFDLLVKFCLTRF